MKWQWLANHFSMPCSSQPCSGLTEAIEPETDKERLLATSATDWLSAVRKRSSTAALAPCTPAPGTPAPSTPAPKPAAAAPSTPLKTLKGTSSLQPAEGEQGPILAAPASASSSSKAKGSGTPWRQTKGGSFRGVSRWFRLGVPGGSTNIPRSLLAPWEA